MSAGTRSEGPTPTPEQQAVLDRIAAQRQRLRARHEARQQARAQAAAQMPEGGSGVLQALLYLRQHPLAAAAGVAAVLVIGPRRCLRWAGVALPWLLRNWR